MASPPRRWREIPKAERARLLVEFLRLAKERPDLTIGQLRREAQARFGISEHAAVWLDDLAWFGGLARTVYRGVPPRPHRALTPEGERALARGFLVPQDLEAAPRWARRAVEVPPPPAARVVRFSIDGWRFWLEEGWRRRLYVEGPRDYVEAQAPVLTPGWLSMHGVSPANTGTPYAVKLRAMVFLNCCGVPELAARRRMEDIVGYKFIPMERPWTKPELARPRHLIRDPGGRVAVRKLPSPLPDRDRWEVDLSAFPELPDAVDLRKVLDSLTLRAPRGTQAVVPQVWS